MFTKKLSILSVLFSLLLSQNSLSQNISASEECPSNITVFQPMEYTRQAYSELELTVYALHLFKKIPSYLANKKEAFQTQMLNSLGILEYTSIPHVVLYGASAYENGEFPGLNNGNDTLVDQYLKAQKELLMPIYGTLVIVFKPLVIAGLCAGDFADFVTDMYFVVDSVVTPMLQHHRRNMNNGKDPSYKESMLPPVPPYADLPAVLLLLSAGSISLGFIQILAATFHGYQSEEYKGISYRRAQFLVIQFAWFGLNNLTLLYDQTYRFLSYYILNNAQAYKTKEAL